MFSGRALPSLDINPRCTEQLGTARWPYSAYFIFLRGTDVVQWKQEEESNWKGKGESQYHSRRKESGSIYSRTHYHELLLEHPLVILEGALHEDGNGFLLTG